MKTSNFVKVLKYIVYVLSALLAGFGGSQI